jgi:hypothetical protein
MMKKSFILLVGLSFAFAACDEIPADEYLKNTDNGPDGYVGTGHKVLLEEFTGVKCNNCPAATKRAKDLQNIYGHDNLVLLGIHAGNLATTDAEHPKAFNTPEGDELFNFFQLFGVPVGFVNRVDYNDGTVIKGDGSWGTLVAEELLRLPVSTIQMEEDSYNTGTRELTVSGDVTSTGTLPANISLCLYVSEDGIVSPQTLGDKSVKVDYVHNHVFRGSLSGTYGVPINLSSGAASFAESVILPEDAVKANCDIIAFIYDRDSYEILQVQTLDL